MNGLLISPNLLRDLFDAHALTPLNKFLPRQVNIASVDFRAEIDLALTKKFPLRLAGHFCARLALRVALKVIEALLVETCVPQRLVSYEDVCCNDISLSLILKRQTTTSHRSEVLWLGILLLIKGTCKSVRFTSRLILHVSRELTTQPYFSIFVNICKRLGKLINRVAHQDGAFGLSRIYAGDEKVVISLIVSRSSATWSARSFAAFVFGLAGSYICCLRPLLKRLHARFEAALEGIALHAAGNRLCRLANLSPWEHLGLARIEVRHGKVRVN